ncbi:ABC-three component system middle component 6 [Alkalibacterium pelagium]|uniref:Uncharacterized protein n=1 Tax=Alkalibacterium pelagium TaxID=426702 RepID=A0A1H7F8X7_9LACT|nr:ABC-three component system middle component 6 [Alkalibacterium pelagium]GEN49432.1 hypothetical protein APE02nite_00970 [Alkalibacterium pelagium]SEK22583.1 hypothetical protein SAMN04488099_101237 [Alkalibacterium pelagium]
MLLPDNIHPELSIYYNGSVVLMELKDNSKQKILDLYQRVRNRNEMSYPVFILSLDWLYLIDAAKIDENGCVELCS